jgi:hypothetical protein
MVYLYYCQACEKDDHKHCELGTPAPKGHYGGSMCRCPCRRDPLWNDPERIHDELQAVINSLIDFEEQSESSMKKDKRKVKNAKNISFKRPTRRKHD